jgi:hypothetical protein
LISSSFPSLRLGVEQLDNDLISVEGVLHFQDPLDGAMLLEAYVSKAFGDQATRFHDDVGIHHFPELAEVVPETSIRGGRVQTSCKHAPIPLVLNLGLQFLAGNKLLDIDAPSFELVLRSGEDL